LAKAKSSPGRTLENLKKNRPAARREKEKKRKRVKREKGLQSPPEYADYPKTDIEVAEDAAAVVDAKRGTADIRIDEATGTAPQWRTIIITIFYPSTAIPWRSDIVIVPIVFAPLPNIATHVIQSPSIGLFFLSHRMSCILRICAIPSVIS
jgi:hypothetical protein